MAWGKEEFRTKYKESNDCFEKIKNNYYELDYEYQMISEQLQQKENIIKEVREYIEEHKQKGYRTPMSDDYVFWNELNENEIKELLEILDKENKE